MSTKQSPPSKGRPTVIDNGVVRKLEQALRDGFSIKKACQLSGIGRTAYYSRLDADEEFANKMALAQEWVTENARQIVVAAIKQGDIAASKWWLERKASDEFSAKNAVSIEEPIRVKVDATEALADLDDLIKWRENNRELRNGRNVYTGQTSGRQKAQE